MRRARWRRTVRASLQVELLLARGWAAARWRLEWYGGVGWLSCCFSAVRRKLMVDKLLLHHHIFLAGITLVDLAIASVETVVADEPGGSAVNAPNMVPIGAEQVDALVAFATIVQMVAFVPSVLADCAEASGK